MQDFVGQQLAPGDKVVHGVGGRRGGLSGPFYVDSFTAKMVRIKRRLDATYTTLSHPGNLVKVPG